MFYLNIVCNSIYFVFTEMARGHQKLQSQAKAQEKAAKMKKQQGHNAGEQKKAALKALNILCAICKVHILVSFYCIQTI